LHDALAIVDRLGREVRGARAVVAQAPDRAVRTGRRALVLMGWRDETVAISLEEARAPLPGYWVVARYYGSNGVRSGESRLGRVGGLELTFDARRVDDVGAVNYDVVLPARMDGAQVRMLSGRSLVGGEPR